MLYEKLFALPEHHNVSNLGADGHVAAIEEAFDNLKAIALQGDLEKLELSMVTLRGTEVAIEHVSISGIMENQIQPASCVSSGIVVESPKQDAKLIFDSLADRLMYNITATDLDSNVLEFRFGVEDSQYPDENLYELFTRK